MASIVSSTYLEGLPQADGRRYVTETHITDDGQTITAEWLGVEDAQAVMQARAARLNAEYAAKAAAEALVVGTALPLTRLEFLSRFSVSERVAIRSAAKTDPVVEDFLSMLEVAQHVVTTHPDTVAGVGYLQQKGLLTAQRASEVLA